MPYFSWQGIDLKGKIHTGYLFACSEKDLDTLLLRRDIAMLRCRQKKPFMVHRAVPLTLKLHFFRQLSMLLCSGVLLLDALKILSEQVETMYFQEIISSLATDINAGTCLSDAMNKYPSIFYGVMITMVQAGQESGSLATSLAALSDYLETVHNFRKSLISAALAPLFTLSFFVVITLIIFIGIIPRFATIFASVNHNLPYITTVLIAMSTFITSWRMLIVFAVAASVTLIIQAYLRSQRGKVVVSQLALVTPCIGPIIKKSFVVYFFRALALLLQGGVPLLAAIAIAKKSITNSVLQDYVQDIYYEIESGSSLSQAMAMHQEDIFSQDIMAVVRVGEETGDLGPTLGRLAGSCQEKVQHTLTSITVMIQPLFMIILGVLVTLLILAVYLPIFNLAQIAT